MAKLSDAQKKIALAWIHDIALWGGLPGIQEQRNAKNGTSYYYLMYKSGNSSGQRAAKVICDELLFRRFNFTEVDNALNTLAQFSFNRDINSDKYSSFKRPAESLASYLAGFCAAKQIYWDDTKKTSYEMEDYTKNTVIGKALWDFNCFTSQQALLGTKVASKVSNSLTGTANNKSTTSRQPGAAPKIGYKASGAHSGDIPNLIGTPNSKQFLSGPVYCITADKTGKNTPFAYITPLKATTTGVTHVSKLEAERVKFASANGYTDFVLWFTDATEALQAEAYCKNAFSNRYANIHVAQTNKVDANGYFKISTELGNIATYIKASGLNEELISSTAAVAKNTELDNIDAYQEAFIKYDI